MIDARKLWLGLAISAVPLALFFFTVDLGRMADALADANYVYVVPGIGLYLVSVLFRTLRWQVLLRHMRPIKTTRLYPVVVVGYMANNLLPMRLGELVRSYYIGEREGISKTSALATIFVERVLDALTLLFFVAAIALFVPLAGLAEAFGDRFGIAWPLLVLLLSMSFVVMFAALMLSAFFPSRSRGMAMTLVRPLRDLLALALSVPFVALFATLLLSAFFPSRSREMAMTLVRQLPERFEAFLRDLISRLLEGLVPLRSPRTLGLLFMLSVPIWMFEAGLFYLVGFSFSLNDVFDSLADMAVAAVLVTAVANILSSVPAAPGGIGLFELAARETLVFMPIASIDRSVAGGFAFVVHAALLLPMILLGQVFLWVEHLSLRGLSRAGRAAEAGQLSSAEDSLVASHAEGDELS